MMAPKPLFLRLSIALVALVLLQLLIWRFDSSTQTSTAPTNIRLKAPAFISIANAADEAVLSTIGDEAGTAAWYQASSPINLALIRSKYRTIERETSDYLLGSVPLENYAETEDVHLYVHKDGWLLAYYLETEPSGKIFDWKAYKASNGATATTKLENVIAFILGTAEVTFTEAQFYDFRYPNATHIMLIVEDNSGENDSFTVNLPNSFGYSERSWFIAEYCRIFLNGTKLGEADNDTTNTQGVLSPTQLPPNVLHTIRLEGIRLNYPGYGGLVIIYREQP